MLIDCHEGSLTIVADCGSDDVKFLLDIFQYWNTRYCQPDDFRPVSKDIINYLKEYV